MKSFKILSAALTVLCASSCATAPSPAPGAPGTTSQRYVEAGVAVEFTATPAEANGKLREGEEAVVRFRVTDASTGAPLSGLNPSAWLDARTAETTPQLCHDKIQAFLGGSLRTSAAADLNTYYVLTLNREGNISVIDPLSGFGGSKLLTLVFLKSPGADWALTSDQKKLFVTMPLVNQVAIVDTTTWRIIGELDAGMKPTAVQIQPDQARVWVTTNTLDEKSDSGVTVIDTASHAVIRQITTGAGGHELAFTDDSKYAFVTNFSSHTLSIVDTASLERVGNIDIKGAPVSLAYSRLSGAVYVASEDGEITSIDAARHTVRSRINTPRGVTSIRFSPDAKWALALNPGENAVYAIASSTDKLVETIAIEKGPSEIAFTDTFAYVRCRSSENVTMIRLSTIGSEKGAELTTFPGGQLAPEYASGESIVSSVTRAREDGAVLIANAADKAIYYYSEGMAAPMGNFQNYKREPMGVLIVDRSLREVEPSVYATSLTLDQKGTYDVALYVDAPRVVHCFALKVDENPARVQEAHAKVEPLIDFDKLAVGRNATLRFRVTDPRSGEPKSDLRDFQILTFLAPGIWQKRDIATMGGDGVYETTITPPQRGVYYVFLSCPSLNLRYRDLPHLILEATP